MKYIVLCTALAAACAAAMPVFAGDKIEEVIITSSRVAMPLRRVGTSVSVLTGAAIEQRGFHSLFDLLRGEPAVAASNTGGAGKATSLRIRGEDGYRTLVLLDGIDISDVSGPQVGPRLEHLMSAGISRVEILRGPQGLMYGADAGGVVNVSTTAPAEGFGGQLSAGAGRYGSSQLAGHIGGSHEAMDFMLSASDSATDGFNARTIDSELRDDDGYDNRTVHGKFGWQASERLHIRLIARNTAGDNEYDGCFDPNTGMTTHDCTDDYDMNAWRAVLDYDSGAFTHQLSWQRSTTEREFFSAGTSSFQADGELERLGYLGSYTRGETLRLVYGIDRQRAALDDGSIDRSRDQDGYYLEYQGAVGNGLFFTAGLRYDDNADFGSRTTWRLSGARLFEVGGGELKLRAAYGTGFRPPSLYEIAYNAGPFASPPASELALKAETSEGFDISLSWFGDSGIYLEGVYFDQEVDNEIEFDLNAYSGYLQGDGSSRSSGVELIGELPLPGSLTLTANYTWNDTETAADEVRIQRPEHLLNIGLNRALMDSRLRLGFNARAAFDAVAQQGEALDDYTLVDVNASYAVRDGLVLYGRIENLLDEDYREVPGYHTGGSAAYVGLRWDLQVP